MRAISNNVCLNLNDFLCHLIDLQVQKCLRIVNLGVGPNSAQSAILVKQGVNALIQLAFYFQDDIKKNTVDDKKLHHVLKVVKFYLDQEMLRVQAALFASDNPPHREAQKQVLVQQALLQNKCHEWDINYDELLDYHDLPLILSQFRITSARVSLKDIELIMGNSTETISAVVDDVIQKNSLPNGYYEQNKKEMMIYRAHCQDIIKHLEILDGVIEEVEKLSLERVTEDLKIWNDQMKMLKRFDLSIT